MNVIFGPQFIRDYLVANFSNIGRFSGSGREFVMESPFVQNDWKKHLSVNVDSGLWQCFKTSRSGNFVSLYAALQDIPYFKAQRELILKNFEFQDQEVVEQTQEKKELELDTSKLIPLNIASGLSEDPVILNAWSFLYGRGLFDTSNETDPEFYLCVEGKFANRIIIPFEKDGKTYYFQARSLDPEQMPKYLNPSTEIAAKPSETLYPYNEDSDHVVVCEGPLDARSLQLQGVNATAAMKNIISPVQAEMLASFKGRVILGFDNDDAGRRGFDRFDKLRKYRNMDAFYVCSPPDGSKDWNEAHIKGENLSKWVTQKSSLYDFEYKALASLSSL